MEPRWQILARAIGTTFLATTLFWFAVAAWLYARHFAPTASDERAPANAKAMADPSDGSSGGARLRVPVSGVRFANLTDTFAQTRDGGTRPHAALDIMAPRGAPVVAASAGKVEKLFVSQQGGKTIYVRSPDRRRIYYYAHLDHYAPGLAEGDSVAAGTPLGAVGSTGNASPDAPHLHFAVWRVAPEGAWHDEGHAIDPYPLLKP